MCMYHVYINVHVHVHVCFHCGTGSYITVPGSLIKCFLLSLIQFLFMSLLLSFTTFKIAMSVDLVVYSTYLPDIVLCVYLFFVQCEDSLPLYSRRGTGVGGKQAFMWLYMYVQLCTCICVCVCVCVMIFFHHKSDLRYIFVCYSPSKVILCTWILHYCSWCVFISLPRFSPAHWTKNKCTESLPTTSCLVSKIVCVLVGGGGGGGGR